MLPLAIKAGIPIIGVETDDLVNLVDVLSAYNPKSMLVAMDDKTVVYSNRLYYTTDPKYVTAHNYVRLGDQATSMILVNGESHPLVFDSGVLVPPQTMVESYLSESMDASLVKEATRVLKGLSIKSLDQVCRLTTARDGYYSLHGLRKTRTQLTGATQGLLEVDTTYDFYLPPDKLGGWLHTNAKYFLQSDVIALRPRGIMLDGPPGVGKSLAAKYIASTLDVPLFRIDIASALDKYIGVSEKQIARLLYTVEAEAPAVLLVDEVEKIFSAGDDGSGTVTRIMSQLLWWLAEHRSRVLTVMTTNDLPKIPVELYRQGRVDLTMRINKLSISESMSFAHRVANTFDTSKFPAHWKAALNAEIKLANKDDFSHAEVRALVHDTIKKEKWLF